MAQGISTAGNQGGLGDNRSALILDVFRVFDTLDESRRRALVTSSLQRKGSSDLIFGMRQAVSWARKRSSDFATKERDAQRYEVHRTGAQKPVRATSHCVTYRFAGGYQKGPGDSLGYD